MAASLYIALHQKTIMFDKLFGRNKKTGPQQGPDIPFGR
jgi:hypothetical protein